MIIVRRPFVFQNQTVIIAVFLLDKQSEEKERMADTRQYVMIQYLSVIGIPGTNSISNQRA